MEDINVDDPNFVAASHDACIKAYQPGLSSDEVCNYYSEWADNYENHLCPAVYSGPKYGAAALEEHLGEDKKDSRILDVAAGTGFCGQELVNRGFTNIDALEPSKRMLEKARSKNVYRKLILDKIGANRTEIEDDTYDALVVTGGMGESHIPVKAIDEMIRIVRPGGVVCLAMREEYLLQTTYKGQLEPYMNEKEMAGKWKKIYRKQVPNFYFEKSGIVFLYEVI